MIEIQGDIWSVRTPNSWLVIPINIGWKRDGSNPMGRGIALQAAEREPRLPEEIGSICRCGLAETPVTLLRRSYIAFPTKPLDSSAPWLSWKAPSRLALVERSTKELAKLHERGALLGRKVYLPLVGCGNGGLPPDRVRDLLRTHLVSNDFVLVLRGSGI